MEYVRRLEKSAARWFAVAYIEFWIIIMLSLIVIYLIIK